MRKSKKREGVEALNNILVRVEQTSLQICAQENLVKSLRKRKAQLRREYKKVERRLGKL